MCGRARCTLRAEDVHRACGFQCPLSTIDTERYRPSYNVSPGSYMPVVRKENTGNDRQPVVHCMKWGLVPSFTKKNEKPDHFRMFNARSESVREKASFRRLIPSCRCLVTVEGFYEWKKDGAKKQPFYIHFQDEKPLVFAALYDTWQDSEGGVLFTFTILTTRSSKALAWLHDRMPVILGTEGAIDAWLNDLSSLTFETVTQPYEKSDLVWYPVTPAMGRTQFDGPECIKEIKLKPEKSNSISDFFSRKGTPVKSSVHETCEAGTDEDQSEIIADHLSVDEQKAFLAGLEPDTEVTKEALPCINEERNLEQCVTKRSFENKDKKGLDSLENETEPKASISNPPIDPSNESGSNRIYSPDLQMKKRSKIHAAGDKQKTLLSYFGRS